MIHLASQSPRRRKLLKLLGIDFRVLDVDVNETPRAGEAPEALVVRLARDKGMAGLARLPAPGADRVLGADTIVVLGTDVLGKPRDADEAAEMLDRLSGNCHRVLSAVAVASAGRVEHRMSESRVCFRALSPAERDAYIATGEPLDKAGAYGIQGRAAAFVRAFSGSWTGVVGLPVRETVELLAEADQNRGLSGSA